MLRILLTLPLLLLAAITGAETLDGAYERVSLTNARTGESPEELNREGLLVMAHGHYAMMTQNPERRVLSRDEQAALDTEEEVRFLREWLDINAHSGRYEAADGALTWYRNISEDPKEVGTVSRLNYETDGPQLTIFFTLPNGDRYNWVWRRISD